MVLTVHMAMDRQLSKPILVNKHLPDAEGQVRPHIANTGREATGALAYGISAWFGKFQYAKNMPIFGPSTTLLNTSSGSVCQEHL